MQCATAFFRERITRPDALLTNLLNDFRNHAKKMSQTPTALVSASDRIVDTVKRAFDMYYENGWSPEDMWIAFIKVTANNRVHSARQLAEECELPEPGRFCHEFLFEWGILEKYVLYRVSLRTLVDCGLGKKLQCINLQMTTSELRCCIAGELGPIGPHNGRWEICVYVGSFARTFGARAPFKWIARRFFDDCVWTEAVNEESVRLSFAHKYSATVDGEFFSDLDQGIETILCDWWLADLDFFIDLKAFGEWRDVLENRLFRIT